jgi:hypothetical protein
VEDRLIELEALQKALLEGTGMLHSKLWCWVYASLHFSMNPQSFGLIFVTEAYDKMQADLITAKENLTKILTSKDLKATVCAPLFTHQAS